MFSKPRKKAVCTSIGIVDAASSSMSLSLSFPIITSIGSTPHGLALQQSKRSTGNSPGCSTRKLHDCHCKNLGTDRNQPRDRADRRSRGAELDRSAAR
uniref:Uncharacterized protein n=1 Tax=Arundo donax TaxID=35708 RepID=A0A0A9DZH6_ARUDO